MRGIWQRLSEPESIRDAMLPLLADYHLSGQQWVINAGPTAEAWDGVRILSNRATGTLGALLARQAAVLGAQVTLVAGPGTPTSHPLVQRIAVESAEQMLTACLQAAKDADIFIGTAAVSDFRFSTTVAGKIKRGDTQALTVELIANPDIIAAIAAMPGRPGKVIGFAAEAEKHIKNARAKLTGKGIDAVVANDIANMGAASASGWWIDHKHEMELTAGSKQIFAAAIIDQITRLNR